MTGSEFGKWGVRIKRNFRKGCLSRWKCRPAVTRSRGRGASISALFIASPFRFCPHCGVQYVSGRAAEYGRLASGHRGPQ